jgi:hypothetical protein
MKKKLALLTTLGVAGSAVLVTAAPASALPIDTPYFTGTVPLTDTNWAASITIAKFNPALGILTGVQCYVTGTAEGEAFIENRSRSAAALTTVNLAVTETLAKPDGSGPIVVTIPLINDTQTLGVYDGVQDFGGTSGKTYPLTTGTDSDNATLTATADLALFVAASPGQTITLPVSAVGNSVITSAGNVTGGVLSSAGAVAGCKYRYEPAAPEPIVPEFPNAAMALASAAAVGAGVIIAKRRSVARTA